MYCKNCGAENPDGTKFCSKCGQPLDAAQPVQQTVIVQAPAPAAPKKNVAPLVLGIIGMIFAFVGAIIWAVIAGAAKDCSAAAGFNNAEATLYLVIFILFGFGGGVLSLVGSIQAYTFKRGPAIGLSFAGLALQIGCLIAQCVCISTFSFLLSFWTLIAVILLLVEAILSIRKAPQN